MTEIITNQSVEPNNDENKYYYEKELDENPYNSPYNYSTINRKLDIMLQKDLELILKACSLSKKGTVLELMAGCGRNLGLLRSYFGRVEMLERNLTMVKAIKKLISNPDAIYSEDIRGFEWQK